MKSANAINAFQMKMFDAIVADIPDDAFTTPAIGHGHTPLWLLGHLALTAMFGQQRLGMAVTFPEGWAEAFGPQTPDPVPAPPPGVTKATLVEAVRSGYAALRETFETASPEVLARPHGIPFFKNTPLVTTDDSITVLLTNHFGFHVAQLSSVRRSLGKPPLL